MDSSSVDLGSSVAIWAIAHPIWMKCAKWGAPCPCSAFSVAYPVVAGTMKEESVIASARTFFTERVRRNLHVVVVFTHCGGAYEAVVQHCPALLHRMYVDRFDERTGTVPTRVAQVAVASFRTDDGLSGLPLVIRDAACGMCVPRARDQMRLYMGDGLCSTDPFRS